MRLFMNIPIHITHSKLTSFISSWILNMKNNLFKNEVKWINESDCIFRRAGEFGLLRDLKNMVLLVCFAL